MLLLESFLVNMGGSMNDLQKLRGCMNDLHKLHDAADKAFSRRLLHAVSGVCGSSGDISTATEAFAGRAPARIDSAQEKLDAFGDLAGGDGAGVKLCTK